MILLWSQVCHKKTNEINRIVSLTKMTHQERSEALGLAPVYEHKTGSFTAYTKLQHKMLLHQKGGVKMSPWPDCSQMLPAAAEEAIDSAMRCAIRQW